MANVKDFWNMWPWYMTLNLIDGLDHGTTERAYNKEFACEIWKLCYLPFKSYCQSQSFFFRTDKRTNRRGKNYISPIYRCRAVNEWICRRNILKCFVSGIGQVKQYNVKWFNVKISLRYWNLMYLKKNINSCEPAQSAQADMGRYFLLVVNFLPKY